MKNLEQEKEQLLNNLIEDFDNDTIDLKSYVTKSEVRTFEKLVSIMEQNEVFDVIFYFFADAMQYLSKNDTDLSVSLELASNSGYSLDSLNSTILATLHATNEKKKEFLSFKRNIKDYFEALEELEDAENEAE